jgi:thiol:disulfide interchange protein
VFLLASCSSNKEVVRTPVQPQYEYAVHFIKNSTLTNVTEQAEKEGKLVFLDLYTDWCLPCQLMAEEVYSDENIGDFINDNFISYKVNAEKGNGPDLKFLYQIENFPGLLFLDSRGRVLAQKQGAAFHTELKELANQAIQIHKENS